MKSLYPCIWMADQAKEAAQFYCSVFPDAKIEDENPMVSLWSSGGEKFMCLNGGPKFQPNPSISIYSIFPDEKELERIWQKLSDGGMVMMPLDSYPWSKKYGWVQDKFGVSWQLESNVPEGIRQRYVPALMFTGEQFGRAEEALAFYTSTFPDSSTRFISRYGNDAGDQEGKINHAQFLLNGQLFAAMDSSFSHQFGFTEGMSLVIPCDSQEEIDFFWKKLTEDGEESMCGWVKDKFGVSWQIVPTVLPDLISDPEKGQRVVEAFLKMKKFDIKALENA
ncbi:VOC family protein [Algoriphagus aestuariicola]|uniref:VOC family protein n=1 Tax=Algoriphagus aestuariicola TaxID=1852016 RepID=A0ABS3BRJ5_9BACT|nr:VOC family protein [Algoriphagus aestuariicola]MBN7801851.1 VOC family protein [Algoriphagus aestuariicola]